MVLSSNPSICNEFSLLYKFESVSGPNQFHISRVPRFFRLGESKVAGGELVTNVLQLPKLIMDGAIFPVLLCIFKVRVETNLL